MIEVRLFATFREGRDKISMLDSNSFSVAGDILDYFHIPHDEVAILLINGRHSKKNSPVKDGDILAVFPPAGGG